MSEIRDVVNIAGDISVIDQVGAEVMDVREITSEISVPKFVNTYYDGPYEVTPAEEDQDLSTQGMVMRQNVRVGKIPSNYGRIAWDGNSLTVW